MRRSEISELASSQMDLQVYHYKICMAGCPAVGKTKLLTRYSTNSYCDSSTMTLIDHVPIKKTLDGKQCVFDYYDTAGQERYMSTVKLYLRNTQACVFVYDVTVPLTLEKMEDFVQLVEQNAPQALKIVVGNKADLEDKSVSAVLDKYRQKNFKCYKASAKSGLNVQELFKELEQRVVKECKPTEGKTQLRPAPISKEQSKKCC